MDWSDPKILLLLLPALPVLWWLARHSEHPMSRRRQRGLLAVRSALVAVVALAVAAPALKLMSGEKAVIFVMDHSQSQGEAGMAEAYARVRELAAGLDRRTQVGLISAGQSVRLLEMPRRQLPVPEPPTDLVEADGAQSDLEAAVALARGLFPPGTSRRLVLVGDGQQTRGNLLDAAREAAISDIVIDAVPVAGTARPDARVLHLRPSRMRLHEGASLGLAAEVDSSLAGKGTIRLFENGIEVEAKPIELAVGDRRTVQFKRTPDRRNLYRYQVRLEGFGEDALEENNEAMTLVDVQGRPLLLYVEGETEQSSYLTTAMAQEGIQLDVRPAEGIPTTLEGLAGYDGIILSDVPAHRFSNQSMMLMRDYVEHLGGGLLMVGGTNSFGVGGYYRTPIEDVLPVKIKAPDKEQRHSVGLVLVIDRSGSMGGQKIELCKSAAIGTVELLSRKDYIGVVVFDSNSRWVVPVTRVSSPQAIASQIATISSGGGTNIYPGMVMGQQGLNSIKARIKHMIVLTDGHSGGGDYQQLASQIASQKITISTVAVGSGAAKPLLQSIAAAGGGKYYETNDPNAIPRIFTQDTMVHVKRMIREETFVPQQVERHPMVKGWPGTGVPPLLGYVKTIRKATAQVPLVTDQGDPLLAHWRYGLGKATAFTSDCKSRWSALWLAQWNAGYSQFWGQVLREMARPPQGRRMDLQVSDTGAEGRIVADLMEDAATFANEKVVTAEVFFVPASALGSSLQEVDRVRLRQEGPGRYAGKFRLGRAGVYLVRARSGAEVVSAGLVRNVSAESATGRVDRSLLAEVCRITRGRMVEPEAEKLILDETTHARLFELRPWLLGLGLLLFIADIMIRRWENVLGMAEMLGLSRRG